MRPNCPFLTKRPFVCVAAVVGWRPRGLVSKLHSWSKLWTFSKPIYPTPPHPQLMLVIWVQLGLWLTQEPTFQFPLIILARFVTPVASFIHPSIHPSMHSSVLILPSVPLYSNTFQFALFAPCSFCYPSCVIHSSIHPFVLIFQYVLFWSYVSHFPSPIGCSFCRASPAPLASTSLSGIFPAFLLSLSLPMRCRDRHSAPKSKAPPPTTRTASK